MPAACCSTPQLQRSQVAHTATRRNFTSHPHRPHRPPGPRKRVGHTAGVAQQRKRLPHHHHQLATASSAQARTQHTWLWLCWHAVVKGGSQGCKEGRRANAWPAMWYACMHACTHTGNNSPVCPDTHAPPATNQQTASQWWVMQQSWQHAAPASGCRRPALSARGALPLPRLSGT